MVLASLPLAISAIEHYRDGLDPLQDYFRYDHALKWLRTRLRIQQDIFEGTLKLLLLGNLSLDQARNLFPDAGQHVDIGLWDTPEIDMKLHERLGSKYEIFMDAVREMEKEPKATGADSLTKPKWQDNSGVFLSTREWRKLKWSFGRKRREALLRSFERCNDHLAKYVEQWEILAPSPKSTSKALSQHYHNVREDACKVYDALENSWKCRDPCSHTVNLQLEARDSGEGSPHFMAALSFRDQSIQSQMSGQKWVETHISVLESNVQVPPGSKHQGPLTMQSIDRSPSANVLDQSSSIMSRASLIGSKRTRQPVKAQGSKGVTKQPSKLKGSASCTEPHQQTIRIRSLCETLQLPQKPLTILGFLTNTSLEDRIAISTGPPTSPIVDKLVSLDRFFEARKVSTQPRESFGNLSGRQRLSIAVTLAHTVLQLHDSPWLNESWSKNDIWFFSSGVDRHKRPNIQRPYISRSFQPQSDQSTSTSGAGPIAQTDLHSHLIINKSLFALGIILIELALNRPFEDLRTDAMNSEPSVSKRSYSTAETYQVATSLIDTVYDEQGTQYGYVVQRCLRCEFGFQDSRKRLEIDAFRAAVYEGVLAPLEGDLKRYSLP
ncbi:MAG: hypothetical protein Q9199_005043 [Rusavskia elegans]